MRLLLAAVVLPLAGSVAPAQTLNVSAIVMPAAACVPRRPMRTSTGIASAGARMGDDPAWPHGGDGES